MSSKDTKIQFTLYRSIKKCQPIVRLSKSSMFRLVPKEFAILNSLLRPDFTFQLDDKSYQCHYFTAAAYSLVVQGLAAVDPDQRSMTVDLPDPCGQFQLIVTLLDGGEIEICDENVFFLYAAAAALRISRLLNGARRWMKRDNIVSIEMESTYKFNGIINYLRDYGFDVVVDASSCESTEPQNVTQPHGYWESSDKPQQHVLFDFGDHPVTVAGYVIESADLDDERHPQSWMVIGSNDMEDWFVIDQRDDVHSLNGRAEVEYFEAEPETEPVKPARYVKVFQTEPNARGDWIFRLGRIEFFGDVVE